MLEKFLLITKPELGKHGYYIPCSDWKQSVLAEIENMIVDGEFGETCLFTFVEHDREEFDNATEFSGW